jgi:drug/metabolite transporter (DMT)-like permease
MQNYVGESAALMAAMGWTISAVCWTSAGRSVGSLVVNTVRLVIALPLFLIYGVLVLGEAVPFSASLQTWLILGGSGVLGFFICDMLLFRSFLMIGPRLAMLIFSLSPVVASLCGWWWLGETLSPMNMIGMAIALSGVSWVVLESPRRPTSRPTSDTGPSHVPLLGILFAFLAMLSQGVSGVIAKMGMQDLDSPVAATEIRLIVGLLCFLVLMPIVGKHKACFAVFKNRKIMTILTIGAIAGPSLGVVLLMFAFKHISTGLAMTFISLTPVMIIPFSVFIFKEHVSLRAMLGAVVACVGAAILLL